MHYFNKKFIHMKNFSNLIVKLTNFVGLCFCFHFLKVKQTYIWIELGHFLGPNTRNLCTINTTVLQSQSKQKEMKMKNTWINELTVRLVSGNCFLSSATRGCCTHWRYWQLPSWQRKVPVILTLMYFTEKRSDSHTFKGK